MPTRKASAVWEGGLKGGDRPAGVPDRPASPGRRVDEVPGGPEPGRPPAQGQELLVDRAVVREGFIDGVRAGFDVGQGRGLNGRL